MASSGSPHPTSPLSRPSPDPASSPRPHSPGGLLAAAAGRLPPSRSALSPPLIPLPESPASSGRRLFTPTFALPPSLWPTSTSPTPPSSLGGATGSCFPHIAPGHDNDNSAPSTPGLGEDESRPRLRRNISSAGSGADQDGQDTFRQQIAIKVKAPVGSMSISPAHRDVVLAARQGLYIIDLALPTRVPRFLPQGGLHSVADVQWSPHSSKPHSVVSTSSEKMLLWNLGLPSERGIEREVVAHRRAVTDINWAVFNDNIVATGSLDGFIKNWDVRTNMDRDCERFSAWGFGSGATQVKWNRKKEFVIASSHDNKVLIWDTRMGSIPVTKITAHSAKIYGIDWSRENAHEIVTCSFDKTIKTWSIPSLNSSVESYEALPSSVASFLPESIHVQPPTPSVDPGLPVHWSPESSRGDSAAVNLTPSRVIHASAPVFRARNLPFGSGLLSLPQSEETHLDLWALGQPGGERVIKTFEGHTDKVKEFVWRIRGGEDLDRDDRSFQLITWGMDQSLRFWPIRESTLLDAGHKPHTAIKVIMTRKGALDQTFIDEPDPHMSLASSFNLHSSISGASSIPAEANSSGFGSSGFFGPVQGPHISAPVQGMNILRTVRTGTHHHHHHHRGPHHLRNALSPSLSSTESSSGVLSSPAKELEKVNDESESTKKRRRSVSAGKERKPVMTRGTTSRGVSSKTDAMVAMEWNDNVEYIHSKVNISSEGSVGGARSVSLSKSRSGTRGRSSAGGSRIRGELSDSANWDADDEVVRLETEFKDVLPVYSKEVKVETFDIPGRKIIFSLNGPWGPPASSEAPTPTSTFIRIGLSFPPTYPKSSTRPTIDLLEMRTIIEPELKQRVRDAVRSACETSLGNCLDLVFRILLGREIEEESERGRSRGQKTVFWEEEKADEAAEESSDSESGEDEDGAQSTVQTVLTKENLRRPCGAAFGFGGQLVSFTTINTTVTSNRGSFSNRSPSVSRDREREPRLRASPSNASLARPAARSMNDAMLLLYRSIKDPNGQKAAPRIPQQAETNPSDSRGTGMMLNPDVNRSSSRAQKPMSILQIRSVDALFVHPRLALAEAYLLKGLPLTVCRRNLAVAQRLGYHSHVRGWQLLELLLSPAPFVAGPTRSLAQFQEEERLRDRTSMAQLNALILEYMAVGDVQMLASMAVVLQLKKDVSSYPPEEQHGRASTNIVRFSNSDRDVLPQTEPNPRLSRLPSHTAEPTSRNQSPASNTSPGPGRRSSYRDNTSSWSMFGSGFNLLGSNISIPHPPSLRETFLGPSGGSVSGGGNGDENLPSYASHHAIHAHRASVDSGPAESFDTTSTLDDRRRGRYRREEESSPPTPLRPQSDPSAAPGGHGSSLRSKILFGSGPAGNGAASYGAAPKMQSVAEVDLGGGNAEKKAAKRPMVIRATFRVERTPPPSSLIAGGNVLHPMALVVFHSAKAGYADFLWRWGLFQKRAELGKAYHLTMVDIQKPPLQVVTSFDISRRETKRQEATGFPVRKVTHALCDLCRKPVYGLSFPCLKCHHLTHPSCLLITPPASPDLPKSPHDTPYPVPASTSLDCPTGCGCVCGRPWEMEGGFAATPSAIRERLGLSGRLALPLPAGSMGPGSSGSSGTRSRA